MTFAQTVPAPSPVINFAVAPRKRATAVTRLCAKLSHATVAFKVACSKLSNAEHAADTATPATPDCLVKSNPENLKHLPAYHPNDFGGDAIPTHVIRDAIGMINNRYRESNGHVLFSENGWPLSSAQDEAMKCLAVMLDHAIKRDATRSAMATDRQIKRLEQAMNRAGSRESEIAIQLVAEPATCGADLLAKIETYHANTDLFSDAGDEFDLAKSIVDDLARFSKLVDFAAVIVPR